MKMLDQNQTKPVEHYFLDKIDFEQLCEKYWLSKSLAKVYLEEIHKRLKEPIIIEGCC